MNIEFIKRTFNIVERIMKNKPDSIFSSSVNLVNQSEEYRYILEVDGNIYVVLNGIRADYSIDMDYSLLRLDENEIIFYPSEFKIFHINEYEINHMTDEELFQMSLIIPLICEHKYLNDFISSMLKNKLESIYLSNAYLTENNIKLVEELLDEYKIF